MAKENWLIIANSGCMKLFRFPKDTRALTEAETFYFDDRHKGPKDVNTDKEGATKSSFGSHGSSYERHIDLRKIEQEEFANTIAEKLHQAALNHEYDRLYLAISKEFYGILKPKLSDQVLKKIAEHTQKDLTHEKLHSIWSHFPSMK